MRLKIVCILAIILAILLGIAIPAGYRNVNYVKSKSKEVARSNHLEIVGYEGYQWGMFGGDVWYIFKRIPDNNITYHGCFFKRPNNEIHLLRFRAIDAIKP